MIMNYMANPNSIILAVTPANQDFATSEPLKLAKDVDKEGMFPVLLVDYDLEHVRQLTLCL